MEKIANYANQVITVVKLLILVMLIIYNAQQIIAIPVLHHPVDVHPVKRLIILKVQFVNHLVPIVTNVKVKPVIVHLLEVENIYPLQHSIIVIIIARNV